MDVLFFYPGVATYRYIQIFCQLKKMWIVYIDLQTKSYKTRNPWEGLKVHFVINSLVRSFFLQKSSDFYICRCLRYIYFCSKYFLQICLFGERNNCWIVYLSCWLNNFQHSDGCNSTIQLNVHNSQTQTRNGTGNLEISWYLLNS